MWFWRRLKNIIWADHVRNEEVLQRVQEDRNNVQLIQRRMVICIGHTLRGNCTLNLFVEGYKGREEEKEYISSYRDTLESRV